MQLSSFGAWSQSLWGFAMVLQGLLAMRKAREA